MNTLKITPDLAAIDHQFDGLMNGYQFSDGVFKAAIEYWTSDNSQLDTGSGVIILTADNDYVVDLIPSLVRSNLSLLIKPNNIAFIYYLSLQNVVAMNSLIIPPNIKNEISFQLVMSDKSSLVQIKKGDMIGYGFFIPITPNKSILFQNQNGAT